MHSVLGAFGLNSSIYDAVNLSWKLALCLRGGADPHKVLPTYDTERRLFANKVIRFSGAFLRFVCNFDLPLASLRGLGDELETHDEALPIIGASTNEARQWLRAFFGRVPKVYARSWISGFGNGIESEKDSGYHPHQSI